MSCNVAHSELRNKTDSHPTCEDAQTLGNDYRI